LIIVIENFENEASRWILAEYREVIRISKKENVSIVFSNVKDPILMVILEKEGATAIYEEGWRKFNLSNSIVLDPQAKYTLEPWELNVACCVVIGGIMGDHPPKGRTYIISSYYTNAAKRNIGPYQFSVDGTVKVILNMLKGYRLNEIDTVGPPIVLALKGPLDDEMEIELPYIYPAKPDGSPNISKELVKLLERGIVWDEMYDLY